MFLSRLINWRGWHTGPRSMLQPKLIVISMTFPVSVLTKVSAKFIICILHYTQYNAVFSCPELGKVVIRENECNHLHTHRTVLIWNNKKSRCRYNLPLNFLISSQLYSSRSLELRPAFFLLPFKMATIIKNLVPSSIIKHSAPLNLLHLSFHF